MRHEIVDRVLEQMPGLVLRLQVDNIDTDSITDVHAHSRSRSEIMIDLYFEAPKRSITYVFTTDTLYHSYEKPIRPDRGREYALDD